jgi:hypothetical protein
MDFPVRRGEKCASFDRKLRVEKREEAGRSGFAGAVEIRVRRQAVVEENVAVIFRVRAERKGSDKYQKECGGPPDKSKARENSGLQQMRHFC